MRVLSGGTFDLVHFGHILHLQECEKLAGWRDHIHLMLVTDKWASQRKGENRPVLAYDERKAILVGLGIREEQIYPVGAIEDLADVVRKVKPDFYVYEFGTNQEAHTLALKACEELGVKLKNLGKEPHNPFGTSTSSIIERIQRG